MGLDSEAGATPLPAQAQEALQRQFGHEAFRPGQEAVIRSALAGRNLLVVMPTGSGKSLLYQLPAMLADGLTLVISPLIALMKDQVDELSRKGLPATFINSSLGFEEQRRRMSECLQGRIRLLYVAPERLANAGFLNLLSQIRIARMAVDEAHCISEWGHDFRPDYRRLKQFRERIGQPAVTALTATATPRVQRDIVESLGLRPGEVDIHVHGFDRPNLAISVAQTPDQAEKMTLLLELVRRESGTGIVYVGTRRRTEEVAEQLRQIEPATVAYHAGLASESRSRAQERFLSGQARIAVATLAFGMGIDKRDVRFVVHFNYPGSVEQYYQEIGRAGRDGLPSRCALFYSSEDRSLHEFFLDLNYPSPEIVRSVYDLLWSLPENPVMLTYAALAAACGEMKDGQAGAAVRLLDAAGMTRALAGAEASVTLDRPGKEVLAGIKGKNQRQVIEALSAGGDLDAPGAYRFHPREIAHAAGLTEEQTTHALAALHRDKAIVYEPPFRGRGIEKLVDPPPAFDKLPIDWKRQEALRRIEEEKLDRMEEYIHHRGCRRAFILRYFGETTSLQCGECDVCLDAARARSGRKADSVLTRQPDIAPHALVAIKHLRFPVGAGMVAELLAGSRNKQLLQWRLDRNPAYGAAPVKQERIKQVIADLIREGYLRREGERDRPVLVLTESGETAAVAEPIREVGPAVPSRLETSTSALGTTRSTPAVRSTAPSTDAEIERAALECIAMISPPVGAYKVAAVITGSKAEWVARFNADRLACHGVVSGGQERARKIVERMFARGLLKSSRGDLPVLTLTARGKAVLQHFSLTAPPAGPACPASPACPEPGRREPEPVEPAPVRHEAVSPQQLLARLLDAALASGREEALSRLRELRHFHPREIVASLSARMESGADERTQSRLAWIAGEAGEQFALPFLIRCAQSPHVKVRRLTVSALGKLIEAGSIAPESPSLRATLELLRNDPAPQVRQYAAAALAQTRS